VYQIVENELVIYVVTVGKREEMEVYKETVKKLRS